MPARSIGLDVSTRKPSTADAAALLPVILQHFHRSSQWKLIVAVAAFFISTSQVLSPGSGTATPAAPSVPGRTTTVCLSGP